METTRWQQEQCEAFDVLSGRVAKLPTLIAGLVQAHIASVRGIMRYLEYPVTSTSGHRYVTARIQEIHQALDELGVEQSATTPSATAGAL